MRLIIPLDAAESVDLRQELGAERIVGGAERGKWIVAFIPPVQNMQNV